MSAKTFEHTENGKTSFQHSNNQHFAIRKCKTLYLIISAAPSVWRGCARSSLSPDPPGKSADHPPCECVCVSPHNFPLVYRIHRLHYRRQRMHLNKPLKANISNVYAGPNPIGSRSSIPGIECSHNYLLIFELACSFYYFSPLLISETAELRSVFLSCCHKTVRT